MHALNSIVLPFSHLIIGRWSFLIKILEPIVPSIFIGKIQSPPHIDGYRRSNDILTNPFQGGNHTNCMTQCSWLTPLISSLKIACLLLESEENRSLKLMILDGCVDYCHRSTHYTQQMTNLVWPLQQLSIKLKSSKGTIGYVWASRQQQHARTLTLPVPKPAKIRRATLEVSVITYAQCRYVAITETTATINNSHVRNNVDR